MVLNNYLHMPKNFLTFWWIGIIEPRVFNRWDISIMRLLRPKTILLIPYR